MSYVCFNCGKKSVMGTSHRHRPGVAGRQHLRKAPKTPKLFKPNLHNASVLVNSSYQKVLLCSRCRRQLKKQGKIKVWTKELPKSVVAATLPVKKEKKIEKKTAEKPVKKTRKTIAAKTPTVSVEELVGKK